MRRLRLKRTTPFTIILYSPTFESFHLLNYLPQWAQTPIARITCANGVTFTNENNFNGHHFQLLLVSVELLKVTPILLGGGFGPPLCISIQFVGAIRAFTGR